MQKKKMTLSVRHKMNEIITRKSNMDLDGHLQIAGTNAEKVFGSLKEAVK